MKETGKFWGKILNWFVGIDLEKIFPQNKFYSWYISNRWMQLNSKIELYTFANYHE